MSITIPRGLQDITLDKYQKLVANEKINDESVVSLMCNNIWRE